MIQIALKLHKGHCRVSAERVAFCVFTDKITIDKALSSGRGNANAVATSATLAARMIDNGRFFLWGQLIQCFRSKVEIYYSVICVIIA